jgi:hypothetical protein
MFTFLIIGHGTEHMCLLCSADSMDIYVSRARLFVTHQ